MSRKIITRILIPAATAVVAKPDLDLECCKRSELPIYSPEPSKKKEKHAPVATEIEPPGVIEETIGTVRKTVVQMCNEVKQYETTAVNYVNEGISQADWLIKYLGEDDNPTPKGPAIAIGGLTGFIFALRGGLIRKVVFTSAGALGMAAVCFPKEAQYYSQVGLEESKKYAKIGYNFIYGDKGVSNVEDKGDKFMALGLSIGGGVDIKKRACHSVIDGSLIDCPDDLPVPEAPLCPANPNPECPDK